MDYYAYSLTKNFREVWINMQNGFIIIMFSWIVENINRISLVEYFKMIAKLFLPLPATPTEKRMFSNIAIDIFAVTKWLFILLIWYKGYSGPLWIGVTVYLIITNIHTYFYYHVWTKPTSISPQDSVQRSKRRLVNLLLAVGYSNTCFAYLYNVCLYNGIKWSNEINHVIQSLQLSWGNALAGSFGSSTPQSDLAVLCLTSQQVLTFVFVAIILSKTTSE